MLPLHALQTVQGFCASIHTVPECPTRTGFAVFFRSETGAIHVTMKKSCITVKQWSSSVPCPWSVRQACCNIRVRDAVSDTRVLYAATRVSCPWSARHFTADDDAVSCGRRLLLSFAAGRGARETRLKTPGTRCVGAMSAAWPANHGSHVKMAGGSFAACLRV